MSSWIARAGHIAAIAFGAWITITSAIGIAVGVHASEGWLAILYGCLGMSMGIAGMAGVWMKRSSSGSAIFRRSMSLSETTSIAAFGGRDCPSPLR